MRFGAHVSPRTRDFFSELCAEIASNPSSSGRDLYTGFGDVAVGYRLLANACPSCDCGTLFRNLLFADHDLRIDGAAQAPDHLRDCGLCGGYCVHQQHSQFAGRLVHRTSFLEMDLLDGRGPNAVDDALHLFRHSAAYPFQSGPELARLRVLQFIARSYLWRAGPG